MHGMCEAPLNSTRWGGQIPPHIRRRCAHSQATSYKYLTGGVTIKVKVKDVRKHGEVQAEEMLLAKC